MPKTQFERIQIFCSLLCQWMHAKWPTPEPDFDPDDWEFTEPDDAELERDDDSNDDWMDGDADDDLPLERWMPDDDDR